MHNVQEGKKKKMTPDGLKTLILTTNKRIKL